MANDGAHLLNIMQQRETILEMGDYHRALNDLAADIGLCIQINVFSGEDRWTAPGTRVELPVGIAPDNVINVLMGIVRAEDDNHDMNVDNMLEINDEDVNVYGCDGEGCNFTGTYDEVDDHENMCNIYQACNRDNNSNTDMICSSYN